MQTHSDHAITINLRKTWADTKFNNCCKRLKPKPNKTKNPINRQSNKIRKQNAIALVLSHTLLTDFKKKAGVLLSAYLKAYFPSRTICCCASDSSHLVFQHVCVWFSFVYRCALWRFSSLYNNIIPLYIFVYLWSDLWASKLLYSHVHRTKWSWHKRTYIHTLIALRSRLHMVQQRKSEKKVHVECRKKNR